MPRPKSKDPSTPITISLPRSLVRPCKATARVKHLSLSAWIASLVREYFLNMEKALR